VGNDALSSLLSVEEYLSFKKDLFLPELNFNQNEKINQNIVIVIIVLLIFWLGERERCLTAGYARLSQTQDCSFRLYFTFNQMS